MKVLYIFTIQIMEAVESIVRMSEKYPDAYATVVEKL